MTLSTTIEHSGALKARRLGLMLEIKLSDELVAALSGIDALTDALVGR